MQDLIFNNHFFKICLNTVRVSKSESNIDVLPIFNDFMDKDIFDLKNIYEEIIHRNAIKFTKERTFYYGSTIYIESLRKNYIKVCESNNIEEASTLIHELGHCKINLQPKKIEYEYTSNLNETYSLFLELQFLEFIKQYGLCTISYNMKVIFLRRVIEMLSQIYDELATNNECVNNKYFIYKFKAIIGYLLAFKLNNMFTNNEEVGMETINKYVKGYGNMPDKQLLESMGLSMDIFKNNNILQDFTFRLNQEKKYILHK